LPPGPTASEGTVPTYQYACTACDHRLEAVQSFSDDPLTECPVCEGRLRKLFGSVGVVFKGSGFYRTDSRAASTGQNGQPGKSDGEKSEPKPAPASPKKEPASAKKEPASTAA